MTTTAATPTSQTVVTGIIDGDGHIRERDEDLYPYFGAKYPLERLRNYYLFPTLDGWRSIGKINHFSRAPRASIPSHLARVPTGRASQPPPHARAGCS
jgi:hypothetical protein